MNHSDRRMLVEALHAQTRQLLGPTGITAAVAAMSQRSAPRADPPPRPPGTGGSRTHADPTPDQALDPTHMVGELAEMDEDLRIVDEALTRLRMQCGREIRRVTPTLLPPEQPKRRWCESCSRAKRADGKPVEEPIDSERYARYCLACGRWKGEHGHIPPIGMVEAKHRRGTTWTTKVVRDAYVAAGLTPPDLTVGSSA